MSPLENFSTAMKTTRPFRSIGFYSAVFLGFILAGMSLGDAFVSALPMYPICMAGFSINDIYDQESDRINHPERALAQYPALTKSVTVIYSCLFVVSIVLIALQQDGRVQALWAVFFLLLSNYAFIKSSLSLIKNVYIAFAGCLVLLLIDYSVDRQISTVLEYIPFCMAIMAREFMGDVEDIDGDRNSIARKFGKKLAVTLA